MKSTRFKFILSFILISTVFVCASTIIFSNHGDLFPTNANVEKEVWNHYSRVEPTENSRGIREYWISCSMHNHIFEQPDLKTSQINDMGYPSREFIDSLSADDDRLITPYMPKLIFTLQSSGQEYSVKAANTQIRDEVLIPDTYNNIPVTSIETDGFCDCEFITLFKCGQNINEIGEYAFDGCSSLENVFLSKNIPDEGYGDNIFYHCPVLKHISMNYIGFEMKKFFAYNETMMPERLDLEIYYTDMTSILRNKFFSKHTKTKIDVHLDSGWTVLTDYMFNEWSSLETISFAGEVTEIGSHAFYNCKSLKDFVMPSTVVSIKDNAFYGASLSHIRINDNVTTMDYNIFAYSSIEYLEFENSHFSILPFSLCEGSKIKTIWLPSNVINLNDSLRFAYYVTDIFYGGTKEQWNANIADDFGADNIRFSFVDKLTYHKDNEFEYVEDMHNNIYGLSITTDKSSFNCSDYLPNKTILSLVKIDSTTSLVAFEFPNTIEAIPDYFFDHCSSLAVVSIPYSIKRIENGAFNGCVSLRNVYYEERERMWERIKIDVSSIPPHYYGENGNYYLIHGATKHFNELRKFDSINDGTFTYVEDNAGYIYGVKSINKSIQSIDMATYFMNKYVVSIGPGAFYDHRNLTNVVLPDSLQFIESSAFQDCSSLQSIVIPENVKVIGEAAFFGCTSLLEVDNHSHVLEAVEYYAFMNAPISYIYIPKTIKTISVEAFQDPTTMMPFIIYFGGTIEEWEAIVSCDFSEVTMNSIRISYYADTRPDGDWEHDYWHFVDGVITPI